MKKLYENTKLFILNNYNGEFNEKILDILTVSVMSLFIRFPEITKEKLPDILNRLEIFFENKTIVQMVTEKYPEYPIDEITETTNAYVIRALNLDDDKNICEEWSMYVSTSCITNGIVNTIAKSIHELIHLLRFNGIINNGKNVKIRDGVSVARYNKETKVLKRKHKNLEEGIVEYFTIEALISLYDFIKNEDVSFSSTLSSFKERFEKDLKESYEIERFFLKGLNKDNKFNELLEYSFIDKNEPLSLITYYNDVIGDSTAFDTLSRELDVILEYAEKGDIANFNLKTEQLIERINGFLMKTKRKNRY